MYVYIKSEPQLWTVGFYAPDGNFVSESDHNSTFSAAERVHWLNGGGGVDEEALDVLQRRAGLRK